MTLRVIGAGLGRTGTLSLKFALEYLGFGPCHHMAEVWANMPVQVPKWLDVVAGKPDWDAVFDGYAAMVDYPGSYYWRELSLQYPDAKIILSLRDPESWFKSVSETIFSERMLDMVRQGPLKPFFEGAVLRDFGDRIGDRDFMVDCFARWNADVIASVPPERLLVFTAKEGWAPLCAFLGVPVPDVPYPRVNSSEEMHARQDAAEGAESQGGPPPAEAIAAMAKAHLVELRTKAFGEVPAA